MSHALRRLPMLLAGGRLLLALALWPLALAGQQRALAAGLLVALLSDILDGQAARWLGQGDEALARLDSLADKVLTLSVLVWLLLLHPAILREQAPLALVALLLAAASWGAGLLRHGRVTGLHLRLAKLGGAAQGAFVLHTFWAGAYSPWLFRLAAGLWCLAAAEETLVQLTRREVGGGTRGLVEGRPSRAAVARALRDRRLPALLAAAAVALALPALWTGWQYDDYAHRALLTARPGLGGLPVATMDLFRFLTGDPRATLAAVERGELAWWTLPEARQAFWRPLTGLTHWLDYQLWPGRPELMHLHSLAWLAALAAAVTALYRRLMGPVAAAGLAAALYALDDARGFAAAWLANRNALVAALLGVLALLAHARWREEAPALAGLSHAAELRGRPSPRYFALLSSLALAGALLAGEAGVATLGYLAAYALWLERGPWRRRLLSLAPALAVVALWRAAYSALGYGAYGTAYVDPAAEPLRFAWAVAARGPLLLLGQWTPLPAEVSPFLPPPYARLLWLAAVAVAAGPAWLFAPWLRADRQARFWATGMLLALPPACAALPANRLLFFVGLGAMGLLARAAQGLAGPGVAGLMQGPVAGPALTPQPPPGRERGSRRRPAAESSLRGVADDARPISRARQVALGGLLVTHLVLGPLLLPLTAYSPALLGGAEAALATLPAGPGVEQRAFVAVLGPSALALGPLRAVREAAGEPVPTSALLLAASLGGAWVERPDAHTLVVRPDEGYLLGFEAVFRAPWHPLAPGEAVRLRGMTAAVTDLTSDGRPAAAAFRFATPLEDPSREWFVWRRGAYVPFTPPPVGGMARVAPVAAP